MERRLFLCTDLDRTLIPNGPQSESPRARKLFSRLAERPSVTLAYVTGRHSVLVDSAIANYQLAKPDFAITDVGTKIYAGTEKGWRLQEAWQAEIAPDWKGLDNRALRNLFHGLSALRLQESSKQSSHKLSYYVPLHADILALEAVLRSRLEAKGIRASLIWSVDEPAGLGLLDVLPERATKLHAIEFLRERLGFGLGETLFAGDSGNDLQVMASAVPSVLVANASPVVREAALAQATAAGNEKALYLARGGFRGMNGNYSAGILEGAVHFQPELQDWMEDW